ncbi:hypothetical protein B0H34DRAFT_800223 [Crassisporium funariophilum]|nr:hypothetical protein B0H34DRAFT_800223 [Crassisporium funariophilum]
MSAVNAHATRDPKDAPADDDKLSPPGLEHVVWTKATSKNGRSYAVGVGKPKDMKGAHGVPEPFSVDVSWPVGTDFVATSTSFYDVAGVRKYELKKNPWYKFYDYCLWIDNNVNYTYGFKDDTDDVYYLTTVISGEHYVQYDSAKPNINKVSGTV